MVTGVTHVQTNIESSQACSIIIGVLSVNYDLFYLFVFLSNYTTHIQLYTELQTAHRLTSCVCVFVYSIIMSLFSFFRVDLCLPDIPAAVLSPLALAGCTLVDSVIDGKDKGFHVSFDAHIKSLDLILRHEPLPGQLINQSSIS